jgi:hypothetical protein
LRSFEWLVAHLELRQRIGVNSIVGVTYPVGEYLIAKWKKTCFDCNRIRFSVSTGTWRETGTSKGLR